MPSAGARPKTLVWIAVLLVALFLVVAGIGTSQKVVCSACHKAQVRALASGPHSEASCYGCHLESGAWSIPGQKASEWFRMYPAAVLSRKPSGPVLETSRHACLSCHEDVMDGDVTQSKGLRILHEQCAKSGTCDTCHSATAHASSIRRPREALMEDCTSCHRAEQASTDCVTCHTGKAEADRLTAGPWQVTHGPNWKKMHGLGRLDSCQTCHDSQYCVRCHQVPMPHGQEFGSTHGEYAKKSKAACLACHKAETFCTSCHGGTPMPHPASFLRRHGDIASDRNDPTCKRCHAIDDCDHCHANHVHPGNARNSNGLPAVPERP